MIAHRYTTNSRGPGQQGTPVATQVGRRHLVLCTCGSWRWSDVTPHAPRLVQGGLVDCEGNRVERKP
jgi:hypothetical protein